MGYIVLARKWRPKTFEEVVGQEHVSVTLKNAIKSGRIAHAYLFSGPRGIGKTTTARLLAKSLNCAEGPTTTPCNKCSACQEISSGQSLDVLEIDGASNRGINEIRTLRENVKFTPASGNYKIYIIDEVHMLTTEAFNALLKTLEEPPAHVKFIFATTQPEKVPSTILSRCQRFDFRMLSNQEIVNHLQNIARAEKIDISEEALVAVTRGAEGSMRDAQSILDQLVSFTGKKITESDVYSLLGTVEEEVFEKLTLSILNRDTHQGLEIIQELLNKGKDLRVFLNTCLGHFRNLVMLKLGKELQSLVDLPPQTIQRLESFSSRFSLEELLRIIYVLFEVEKELRGTSSVKLALEMAVIKLTELPGSVSFEEILNKLGELERKIEGGREPEDNNSVPPKSIGGQVPPQSVSGQAPPKGVGGQVTPQREKDSVGFSSLSISRIIESWPEIIKEVRLKKITTAAFLAESKPVQLDGKTVTLSFNCGCNFHKENVEAEDNRRLVENILKEKFKEDIIIACILAGKEVKTESNGKEQDITSSKSHDPLVNKILNMFKGEIIEEE